MTPLYLLFVIFSILISIFRRRFVFFYILSISSVGSIYQVCMYVGVCVVFPVSVATFVQRIPHVSDIRIRTRPRRPHSLFLSEVQIDRCASVVMYYYVLVHFGFLPKSGII